MRSLPWRVRSSSRWAPNPSLLIRPTSYATMGGAVRSPESLGHRTGAHRGSSLSDSCSTGYGGSAAVFVLVLLPVASSVPCLARGPVQALAPTVLLSPPQPPSAA